MVILCHDKSELGNIAEDWRRESWPRFEHMVEKSNLGGQSILCVSVSRAEKRKLRSVLGRSARLSARVMKRRRKIRRCCPQEAMPMTAGFTFEVV